MSAQSEKYKALKLRVVTAEVIECFVPSAEDMQGVFVYKSGSHAERIEMILDSGRDDFR